VIINDLLRDQSLMHRVWTRVVTQLLARVTGPLKFRLVLQPAMATFLAIRDGLADAKAGKPPYFWALLWDAGSRTNMIRGGWKSIEKVFLVALLIDVVYQIIVLRFVYVGEAVIVAFVLAIIPYLVLRGPVSRLAGMKKRTSRQPADKTHMKNAA